MLTIGNVIPPHESSPNLKLTCPKELTLQKRFDHFSISVVQDCSAIKKGLLWELQQNRLFFNRWKERFFILTTDYLTCFKKGSKKVGMSEMGSFVYKINLNDIKNLNWVDKKKNGVIGVHLANTVIFLWNNADTVLDEWMAILKDSTLRTKDRRSEAIRKSATLLPNMMISTSKLMKRNDSPNLVNLPQADDAPSDNGTLSPIIPPPPPPRRYLRCLSTDLGKMATSLNNSMIISPSLSRNTTTANSPIITNNNNISTPINNTVIKNTMFKAKNPLPNDLSLLSSNELSDAGNSTISSSMSQSLRCKSSYSIQYSPLLFSNGNSPGQLHQSQQRRLAAKRLSTLNHHSNNNNNHYYHHQQLKNQKNTEISLNDQSSPMSYKNFQLADSEFTFVNPRPAKLKTLENDNNFETGSLHLNNHRTGNESGNSSSSNKIFNNNNKNNHLSGRNNRLAFASLMVDHNRKFKDKYQLDSPAPPPPIPPHRTHLHHF